MPNFKRFLQEILPGVLIVVLLGVIITGLKQQPIVLYSLVVGTTTMLSISALIWATQKQVGTAEWKLRNRVQ